MSDEKNADPRWREPSEAQVEILARAFHASSPEGRAGFTWPLGTWDRERDMENARAVLIRVFAEFNTTTGEDKDND